MQRELRRNPARRDRTKDQTTAWCTRKPTPGVTEIYLSAYLRGERMEQPGARDDSRPLDQGLRGKAPPTAYFGRVDLMFVSNDSQRWGAFDPTTGEACPHKEVGAGDWDLMDFAAVQALLNGRPCTR
jgi:hypothetical protein